MNFFESAPAAALTALTVVATQSYAGNCWGSKISEESALTPESLALIASTLVVVGSAVVDGCRGEHGKVYRAFQIVGTPLIAAAALAGIFSPDTVTGALGGAYTALGTAVEGVLACGGALAGGCYSLAESAVINLATESGLSIAFATFAGLAAMVAMAQWGTEAPAPVGEGQEGNQQEEGPAPSNFKNKLVGACMWVISAGCVACATNPELVSSLYASVFGVEDSSSPAN